MATSTADRIKILKANIASWQSQLSSASTGKANALADQAKWCGDKPYCRKKGTIDFFHGPCYSDTGDKNDMLNWGYCDNAQKAYARYDGYLKNNPALIANAQAELKKLGATSITKKVIIWTLVIIAVGLTIFFVGRHYKKW